MTENTEVVITTQEERDIVVVDNDQVPDRWKGLFTNEEWFMHNIVVLATYGFGAIAIVAHLLVWLWRPWLTA